MTTPDPYQYESPQFGPVVGAYDVDLILYEIIKLWQVSYLREIARRVGEDPGEFRAFRSWRVSHELEHMPEDQTPALIIVNDGLQDVPLKMGTVRPGKSYYAVYRYRIGCLLSAKGKKINAAPRANRLAKMYSTAVREILIQKRDDHNVLGMIDWIDEGPGPLTSDDDRTIALWYSSFNVEVPNAAAWATGPLVPDPDPDNPDPDVPLWPKVVSADVDVVKEGLTADFPDLPVPPPVPNMPQSAFSTEVSDIMALAAPTMGDQFAFPNKGIITAVRFWRTVESGPEHDVHLWDMNSSSLAATVHSSSAVQGWVEIPLDDPVPVFQGQEFSVAVDYADGEYVSQSAPEGLTSDTPDIAWVRNRQFLASGGFPSQTTGTPVCNFTDVVYLKEDA